MNNTKNITLNSQLDYWNGQKKTISREGLGMKGRIVSGNTRQIQTGAIINPNNAPPRISNLFSKIFLWNFMWKECRRIKSSTTNRNTRYSRFYKHLSLRIIILSKGTREWTTLTKIRSGFGCAKSSIKMGGQLESGQPKLRLHLQT